MVVERKADSVRKNGSEQFVKSRLISQLQLMTPRWPPSGSLVSLSFLFLPNSYNSAVWIRTPKYNHWTLLFLNYLLCTGLNIFGNSTFWTCFCIHGSGSISCSPSSLWPLTIGQHQKLMATIFSFVATFCGRASYEPAGRWQLPVAMIWGNAPQITIRWQSNVKSDPTIDLQSEMVPRCRFR